MTDQPQLIGQAFALEQGLVDSVHGTGVRHRHVSKLRIRSAVPSRPEVLAQMVWIAFSTIPPGVLAS